MAKNNPIDLYIGQKLYNIRRQAGRSRIDVAAAIDVEPEQLREFETGAERVPAAVLLRLSQVFQLDVLEFFRGLPAEEPTPGASVTMVSETTEEAEATALLRDFSRIRDQRARQVILSLVAGYAENEAASDA
ncbi:MAG: helix-turn-helix transcriptional regulator [Candidatus Pacebacteria bacterium]|jgi:transcriptional regulator with XRE-family HTH domain|nr:helix-turn-helix transcriptional regulator [Candidatus Paceibacterota bacterium]